MKILVVTPKFYPDNFSIIPLVDAFIKEGNDVTVLTSMPFDKNGNYLAEYKDQKVEFKDHLVIHRLKVKTRKKNANSIASNYLSFYFLSKRWVKKCREEFDVVYTFEVSPVTVIAAGNYYKKKHHVRHVVHVLDIWPESLVGSGYFNKDTVIYRIMRKWSKRLYQGADELLIGSPSFKEYLEDYLNVKGVPIKYVSQPGLTVSKLNSKNPYEEGTINILYCGNISTVQLVHFIVPAMNLIESSNIHFTIIGQGRYAKDLVKEIEESPKKNQIHYLGEKLYEDVYDYYVCADAILVSLDGSTSIGKTIPNKLISSLYYGRPILGMLSGDGERILIDGHGGILVNQTVNALAQAIKKIATLTDKEKTTLGSNNKVYFERTFNLNTIKEKILVSLSGEEI